MNSGIYLIKNKITEKVYVGQSKNVKSRIYEHRVKLRNNLHCNGHLQSSVNKYGIESFIFKKIESCEVEKLNEREIFWIKELDSANKEKGYNKTEGGSNAVCKAKKFKIENIFTGEIVEGKNLKKFAEERGYGEHAHFSCLLSGRIKTCQGWRLYNTEHKSRLKNFKLKNIKTGEIVEGYNVNKFCKQNQLPKYAHNQIRDLINGRKKYACGWTLPDSNHKPNPNRLGKNNRPYKFIVENIKSGEIVEGYNFTKFCQEHNIPLHGKAHLVAMLKGKKKTAYGWRLPQDSRQ